MCQSVGRLANTVSGEDSLTGKPSFYNAQRWCALAVDTREGAEVAMRQATSSSGESRPLCSGLETRQKCGYRSPIRLAVLSGCSRLRSARCGFLQMHICLRPVHGTDLGEIEITSQEFTIGRKEGCDLRLRYNLISRRHCVITIAESHAYIQDLKSRYVCQWRACPRNCRTPRWRPIKTGKTRVPSCGPRNC